MISKYCIKIEVEIDNVKSVLNQSNIIECDIPNVLKLNKQEHKVYIKQIATNYESWLISDRDLKDYSILTIYIITPVDDYKMIIKNALLRYSNELSISNIKSKIKNNIVLNPYKYENSNSNLRAEVSVTGNNFWNSFSITYIIAIIIYIIILFIYGLSMNKFSCEFIIEKALTIIFFVVPLIIYQIRNYNKKNYNIYRIIPRETKTTYEIQNSIDPTEQSEFLKYFNWRD